MKCLKKEPTVSFRMREDSNLNSFVSCSKLSALSQFCRAFPQVIKPKMNIGKDSRKEANQKPPLVIYTSNIFDPTQVAELPGGPHRTRAMPRSSRSRRPESWASSRRWPSRSPRALSPAAWPSSGRCSLTIDILKTLRKLSTILQETAKKL